jgi:AraC-like DNA-binding protein
MNALASATRIEAHALHAASAHAHEQGQLTFVEQGACSLEAGGRVWAVPAGKLYWIPARAVHASASRGPMRGWLMTIPQELARHLPGDVCVLQASPLLLAALDRMRATAPQEDMAAPLMEIIALEIAAIEREPPGLTLPRSPRIRAWAERFLASPDAKTTIGQAAAAAAMSRRSFTRHFEQEAGLSFARWKRAVIVHEAIARLAAGTSVSDIAYALGYENVSAFIAMFKAARGASPRAFQKSREHGE